MNFEELSNQITVRMTTLEDLDSDVEKLISIVDQNKEELTERNRGILINGNSYSVYVDNVKVGAVYYLGDIVSSLWCQSDNMVAKLRLMATMEPREPMYVIPIGDNYKTFGSRIDLNSFREYNLGLTHKILLKPIGEIADLIGRDS